MAIAAVMVSVAGAASAQGSQWTDQSSGLPVSRAVVTRLSIHPKDGGLFGLTTNGRLFRSSDGGQHWTPVSSITGVRSLVMDVENPNTIYATTDHGVLKTTNRGGSWNAADKGVTGFVRALVIDPYDSATLYALTSDNGLFKTSDGAATWNEVQTGLHDGNSNGVALSTGPGRPATVYLVYSVNNANLNQSGIATSTDGGATWSSVPGPSNIFISSLTIDPASPSTIYATSYSRASVPGGIFKTTDGGANWEAGNGLPQNDSISSVAIDPTAPSTLYATYTLRAAGGILKSTNGGGSFGPIGAGIIPGLSRPTLAIDPATSTVYVAYYGQNGSGVLKSGDGGNSWE